MEKYGFKGWIPTVSGRLSYSVIGLTGHPDEATTANVADKSVRYVISYQKREFYDTAFPIPLLRKLFANTFLNQDSLYWCVFIGKASNASNNQQDSVKGRIYLFNDRKLWEKTIQPQIYDIQNQLLNCSTASYKTDLEYDCKGIYKGLTTFLDSKALYATAFKLERSGTFSIGHTDTDDTHSDIINDEYLQEIINEDAGFRRLIISQLFFFAKDLVHQHKHHHKTSDTIVDIHESSDDDFTWRCRVLKGLYRQVLSLQRDTRQRYQLVALGILAYTSSFKKVCKKELTPDTYDKLPLREDEELRLSIKASGDAKKLGSENTFKIFDLWKYASFALIGIFLSVAGLARVFENTENTVIIQSFWLRDFAQWVINSPLQILFIFVAITLGALMISGRVQWTEWTWVKDTARLLITINKKPAILTVLMLSLICAYITWQISLAAGTFIPALQHILQELLNYLM